MIRLMIVDDSNVMRRAIERLHGNSLFTVVASAENGVEAMRLWEETDPEVVTMDITMPEMDGIETTKRLIDQNPYIRILVVSALNDEATAIEAIEAGANGFLCKPFTDEQLQSALEEIIRE